MADFEGRGAGKVSPQGLRHARSHCPARSPLVVQLGFAGSRRLFDPARRFPRIAGLSPPSGPGAFINAARVIVEGTRACREPVLVRNRRSPSAPTRCSRKHVKPSISRSACSCPNIETRIWRGRIGRHARLHRRGPRNRRNTPFQFAHHSGARGQRCRRSRERFEDSNREILRESDIVVCLLRADAKANLAGRGACCNLPRRTTFRHWRFAFP